ncbi:hypothetical protein QYE76_042544 [Lolium multiflorum]|uniref:Uncharacterized protein n=1 Tax=Lolium multiflorum TaxID=4521 RepID=A0AAD8TFT3_LOLMU|nr:hypothetical protein QYE76_042544 [Lolium multiflorum]
MGTDSEDAGWPEPMVPPVLEKKKKKKTTATSPSKTTSATSSPAKDAPHRRRAATKPAPAPCRAPGRWRDGNRRVPSPRLKSRHRPPPAPRASPSCYTSGAPHLLPVRRPQLGWIVELTCAEADLGSLKEYVDKWNRADLSAATCGIGKDKLPVVDNSGPRSTVQHFSRLKRAMKEFDTAWHDANANVVGTLDSRKQLFEGLLWEHRDLSEAFSTLERTHGKCQAALPEASLEDLVGQIAALKAEKEKLALEHRNALQALRNNAAELKDQLVQAWLEGARALKEAIAAGDAKSSSRTLYRMRTKGSPSCGLRTLFAIRMLPGTHTIISLRCTPATHMKVVDRHLGDVPEVALQVFKLLWPGEPMPDNLTLLAHA